MNDKKSCKPNPIDDGFFITPSANPIFGNPENTFDILTAYGEYNVQKTADTDNEFPIISQGLDRKSKKKRKKFGQ